ncbi:MAG: helix-turn-helix transcriptional regulator [Firmicutes bacterium]|nr:helix-turn-helix transcriptional regulator [Bacillota bacterium]
MRIELRLTELIEGMGREGLRWNMTPHKLSVMTGIRYATIRSFLQGTWKQIGRDQIARLCEAFHCQPGDLFKVVEEE